LPSEFLFKFSCAWLRHMLPSQAPPTSNDPSGTPSSSQAPSISAPPSSSASVMPSQTPSKSAQPSAIPSSDPSQTPSMDSEPPLSLPSSEPSQTPVVADHHGKRKSSTIFEASIPRRRQVGCRVMTVAFRRYPLRRRLVVLELFCFMKVENSETPRATVLHIVD